MLIKTLAIANEIMAVSKQIGYKKGVAKAKQLTARVRIFHKTDSLGFDLANDALNYAASVGADSVYLDCINILGFGSYKNKQLHKVFEYNQKGLAFAKKINHHDKIYTFTVNAGSIFSEINEHEKALNYFEQARLLFDTIDDNRKKVQLYIHMAAAFYEMEDFKSTEKYIKLALAIPDASTDKTLFARVLTLQGKLSLAQNNVTEAEKHFEKAKLLLAETNNKRRIVESILAFTHVEIEKGNFELAKEYATEAQYLSETSNFYQGQLTASKLLHAINSNLKLFEASNTNLLTYTTLLDSLQVVQNEHKFRIALTEQSLLKEKEILMLQVEKNQARQKMIISISSLLLLVFLAIILIVKRNESIHKTMNHTLSLNKTKLEKQSKQLHKANSTKEKLFAIVAHDLRSPINSFQGLLNMFRTGETSQNDFLAFMPKLIKDIEHISFTLNNLLSWGQSQLEGIVTQPKHLSANKLFLENINLLRDIAEKKGIVINNSLPDDINIWSDQDQIDIVIRNLISNALKFTPNKGKIDITAREVNDLWEFAVSDNGVGMDLDTKEKIFSISNTTSTYGTNNEKGIGLGLSLCKEMIENNEGFIWCESSKNKGSTFFFSLPKSKNQLTSSA